ncbi:excinuclease ABC subunit UvrA [Pseudorhodoferax soli]|uniref:UvrABC system protein A n=1 Tax=Pseudorhodoferax soli TaxID=545864 RepID=A0A368XPU6_9BURK|nr:excinuclease ABC subunit UvrA [Pseudorhodoferax soli]RCW69186.1 excinuclease ABC subunit A [Pseudorhodoferax soli]
MASTHRQAPSSAAPQAEDGAGFVQVRGAREHNLKNVDVDIPRNAFVVFTGISGSGKSSLAFGTLFAEAQRRYLDSIAPYARRLVDQVGIPQVDAVDGMPPAVALQQQRGTPMARSSVGSVSTVSNLLRLLFSRAGHYPAGQAMLFAEDFSPNTAQGACPQCHGLGRVYDVTERSAVPDDSLSIRQRAVAAWPGAWQGQNLRDILTTLGHDVDRPWRELPQRTRDWILFTDEQPTVPVYAGFDRAEVRAALKAKMAPSYMGTFTGVRRHVLHTFANSPSAAMRKRVAPYMVGTACSLCGGRRLKPAALAVRFAGHDIAALGAMPMAELAQCLAPAAQGRAPAPSAARGARPRTVANPRHAGADDVLRTPEDSQEKTLAAQRLAGEILARLQTMQSLGLGYLSLDRATPSLSAGELQRLRLATQIGSKLFGVVYVLDEPSAGLHPADGEALHQALARLKAAGNTLFVVEHDVATMRAADWLVDVGPAAGSHGGEVLYSGPPAGLAAVARSQTRPYLFPDTGAPAARRTVRQPRAWLRLQQVRHHNLDGVDADFPIGCLSVVTGVSGSGKSSLVSQALLELVRRQLHAPAEPEEEQPATEGDDAAQAPMPPVQGRISEGLEHIARVVQVDQRPIGRTPRSNLATYTGLFDAVRKLFAATPEARRRRFDAGRFSFNVAKGRCATCTGEGFVSVELLFLPSVYAPCPACHGKRYNEATLKVAWQGMTIADVLDLTVEAACARFAAEPAVLRPLEVLRDIGLGYLRLGQPATELSGGEAQRIKLATELHRPQNGRTLYVLDEPTTGLHPADVDRLLAQIGRLVAAGNTVVAVEHDMRVAAAADWLIDIGPGAGPKGGRIVAAGPPDDVARQRGSATAPYLAQALR